MGTCSNIGLKFGLELKIKLFVVVALLQRFTLGLTGKRKSQNFHGFHENPRK